MVLLLLFDRSAPLLEGLSRLLGLPDVEALITSADDTVVELDLTEEER